MAAGSEASSSQPLLRAVLLEQARHLSVTEALLTCRAQGWLRKTTYSHLSQSAPADSQPARAPETLPPQSQPVLQAGSAPGNAASGSLHLNTSPDIQQERTGAGDITPTSRS
ncbi:hypothetical protein WJX82_003971 [Trebouxia sp. C0006]